MTFSLEERCIKFITISWSGYDKVPPPCIFTTNSGTLLKTIRYREAGSLPEFDQYGF